MGKALIVLGSGRCVWDDISRVNIKADYMAVNDVGMHFPGFLNHWYSNDVEMLRRWASARRPGYNLNFETHSCNPGVKHHHHLTGNGTSSLNAVVVGKRLGYEKIILCGIPLDDSGHYFDPPWIKTNFSNEVPRDGDQIKFWSQQDLRGVYSMSGRTRELLGGP